MTAAWDAYGDEVYTAIREFFGANWTATPVKWPNEPFTTPRDAPWISFEIEGTTYGQETMGESLQENNRWDESGVIWFHIFAPRGTGNSNASGAANAIRVMFRGRRLLEDEDLTFLDARKEAGEEDGAWYRVTVAIEWEHVEA